MLDYLVLFVLALLAAFWWSSFHARETARRAARRHCEAQGVQFLDDSVALTRLRVRREVTGRLALYREYRFEFSHDGEDRFAGQIRVIGRRVLGVDGLWQAVH